MAFRLVLLILLISSLSACGSSKDVRSLHSKLDDIRILQSEQTTQIAGLEERLRQLAGRIEEVEYIQNRRVGGDLAKLKKDIHKITRRVPPPPIVPVNELESDEVLVQSWSGNFKQVGKKILELVRLGRYRGAMPYLDEALNTLTEPTRAYGPTLLFWRGVVADGMADNRLALQSYAELVAQAPKHRRAPLALLRQASVFVRLGDSDTAKLTLKKLIKDYSRSEYKAHAQEKLKDL